MPRLNAICRPGDHFCLLKIVAVGAGTGVIKPICFDNTHHIVLPSACCCCRGCISTQRGSQPRRVDRAPACLGNGPRHTEQILYSTLRAVMMSLTLYRTRESDIPDPPRPDLCPP